ncbi:MAG TPA: iron-containing alcohol dehydrogenase [Verrucomicrobiales bacterium]|jgi:alcohol dehydrogenase class IV|nr:iron-containing alcohol dehydrogenase [Verrucomicrobiales bacterium]
MRNHWNFFGPGRLVFGSGSISGLGGLVSRRGLGRILVVTDKNLVAAGILERVRQSLEEAKVNFAVFDGGEPEPSLDTADRAVEAAWQFLPDAILGLGGGSNIDLAKIVATLLAHGGGPADYFGFDRIPGRVTPLICVPTTAGTGSEVSHSAVLTDSANHIKVSTLSEYLRPALAIVDPSLTLSCPAKATADSGIDALTHAIEAFTVVPFTQIDTPPDGSGPYDGKTPFGDMLAERAIALIGQNLVTAVKEPDNLSARENMALAATLAGMAFSNCGVSIVHALEYPIGAVLHVSHGAGNGLLLPYVMRFNLPVRTPEFARIAALLGADTHDLDEPAAAEAAVRQVEQLKRDIGIPERLRDISATSEQLPAFAEKSFAIKRLVGINPRPVTESDLLGILQEAL